MNLKTISISIFKLVLPLFVILFVQFAANAQTAVEQQCMNAVQGKVAWNQAGATAWGEANLRNLCQGTSNPSATISCFQNEIRTHNDWSRGISACKTKAASIQNSADAQQPDLNGTWTIYDAVGNRTPKTATISHGQVNNSPGPGITVIIVDGDGKKFSGGYQRNTIAKGSETDLSKPLSERLSRLSGDVSQDGTAIRWSDNTVWKRVSLSGTWTGYYGQGNLRPAPGTGIITQKGFTLTIDNGEGSKSTGKISGNTITATEWGITGIVSEDGTKISWSNNTNWKKNNQSMENTPARTALSANDMNLIMTWIAAQVSAERLPFCYRQSFTRDAGEPASTCANGWEKVGLRCFPKCQAGYERSGPNCIATCPQGFKDIGLYCQKPAAYGRGAGWAGYSAFGLKTAIQRCEEGNRSKGDGGSPAGQSCEMWGAYAYPKCKPGFHNVGANICSPDCPYNWQDSGTGCKKPALPSNLSGDAFGCNPGKEKSGELCYNKCNKADYSGVGPVCWQNCPSQMPVNCGAGCATTSKDCAMAVTDMVISPILAAVSLATLGGASGVTATGNVIKGGTTQAATKAPGIIAKMKAIYAKIKTEVEVAKLSSNAYKTSSSILSERDLVLKEFSENFVEMTSYEINKTLEERLTPKQFEEVRLEWAKRHFYLMGQTNADVTLRNALTLASVVDPSGLLAVEKAFYHPVCKNKTPFPTLENYGE